MTERGANVEYTDAQYDEHHDAIAAWAWDAITADVESCDEPDDEGNRLAFLGTVFALVPSGKYYTPWANSNVTEADAANDAAWYAALDQIADEHNLFVTSGEGDPCDIFVGRGSD